MSPEALVKPEVVELRVTVPRHRAEAVLAILAEMEEHDTRAEDYLDRRQADAATSDTPTWDCLLADAAVELTALEEILAS